jgi:hypothetical protein
LDPTITGPSQNLHRQRLHTLYSSAQRNFDWRQYLDGDRAKPTPTQLLGWVQEAYESGESAISLIDWIRKELRQIDVVMHFHRIKSEYRCEKMLMFCLLARFFQ